MTQSDTSIKLREALRTAMQVADSKYTFRRKMDKSGWEVVEWPDSELAANDMLLFSSKSYDEAQDFFCNLKLDYMAKAVLEAA